MQRVLLAWELGANYGHLYALLPLAATLRARGFEPVLVIRDLSRVQQIMGDHEFRVFQAPIWQPKAIAEPASLSYAGVLLKNGYMNPGGILGLVKAWRNLFDLIKPALLILDHAPTALLASNGLGISRMLYGSGFASPPDMSPLPPLRLWEKVAETQILREEQRALEVINKVLDTLGERPLDRLCDLFKTEANLLRTVAELDHYPRRENGRFMGPPLPWATGSQPKWPGGNEHKVFVYVYPEHKDFAALMEALNKLACTTLVHAPGITPQLVSQYESASLRFSKEPLNMSRVSNECDMGVVHSPIGAGAELLLKGKPLLVLPRHTEQLAQAFNVMQLGAGLMVKPMEKNPNYKKLIKSLLNEEKYKKAAEGFAGKYSDLNRQHNNEVIADLCETLIGQSASDSR